MFESVLPKKQPSVRQSGAKSMALFQIQRPKGLFDN